MAKIDTICGAKLKGAEMKDIKRVEILPLDGKYYGTDIEITFFDDSSTIVSIWYMGDGQPSNRELSKYDITENEWKTGKLLKPRDNGWGGMETDTKRYLDFCDSHYESKDGLELCEIIKDALIRHEDSKELCWE